jgi:lysophospholipase L1-like esterase
MTMMRNRIKNTIYAACAALFLHCCLLTAATTAEDSVQKGSVRAADDEVNTFEPLTNKTTLTATKKPISKGPFTENMSAEQQAWEDYLKGHLGGFHWPRYVKFKKAGIECAWDYVEDDPSLPRVLLIGDSISRGYTLPVRHRLDGKANLHRIPQNGGPTSVGLRTMNHWLGDRPWNVITFNFGIHNRGTKDDAYRKDIEKIVAKLKTTGAKLIWVSTTPTLPGAGSYPAGYAKRLNSIAEEIMKREGIEILDLGAKITPQLKKYQLPRDCHYTLEGYEFLGESVANAIEGALKEQVKNPQLSAKDLANGRVMVLGDSITRHGTWVSFLSYYLMCQNPDLDFDVISIGLSSETASGLSEKAHNHPRPCVHERLKRALAMIKPTTVLACYGMNDGIYHPASPKRDKAYQDGVLKLVKVAQDSGVKNVLLMGPGQFDETANQNTTITGPWGHLTPYTNYDAVLAGYSKWIMGLDLPNVHGVDLNTPMNRFVDEKAKKHKGFRLSGDGVHVGDLGHLIMAQTVARKLGLDIDANPEIELKRIKSDSLYRAIAQQRKVRSDGWLPYVGYTRHGKAVKTASADAAEAKYKVMQAKVDGLLSLKSRTRSTGHDRHRLLP